MHGDSHDAHPPHPPAAGHGGHAATPGNATGTTGQIFVGVAWLILLAAGGFLVRRMAPDQQANTMPFMILMLPLLGFTVLALFGDAIRDQAEDAGAMLLACLTVVTSFAIAAWRVWALFYGPGPLPLEGHVVHAPAALKSFQPYLGFEWIDAGGLRVPLSLLLDNLSSVMILTVTGIGSLIHIYSVGYMSHDPERVRYFSYLNLFTFFMLVLVLGGSLPLMFVGWEGVGLCSYLLIGFWFKKKSASDAGMKAFVVNRIGDAGVILGTILAFYSFGTVDLVDLVQNADAHGPEAWGVFGPMTGVCLLLFVGACGKSAQIPLHVWLPDAMEGPTPVSALIHAATMVTAGVYMVCRLGVLFDHSHTAMTVVAVTGATTALMAALVALVQTDIKKVLAYSTVSQLGYMFLAAGVGAFGVAIFHLFTHAFFKALLFLGSGSVIHALSGEQDMRKMGGLWKKIPWTFGTFAVGTAAIAGIPPLAGFFSKDQILHAALAGHHEVLFGIGLFTAGLTAFYMTRLFVMTFLGTYRGELSMDDAPHGAASGDHGGHEAHGGGAIHESPWSMLAPLVLLAIGSALVGLLVNIPHIVGPAVRVSEAHEGGLAWLPFVATGVALVPIALAFYAYLMYAGMSARIARSCAPLLRVLEEKWGFDLAYDWFASRVVVDGSRTVLWRGLDAAVIDGAVNGTAGLVGLMSQLTRGVQTGLVRGYALVILGGAVALLGFMVWF